MCAGSTMARPLYFLSAATTSSSCWFAASRLEPWSTTITATSRCSCPCLCGDTRGSNGDGGIDAFFLAAASAAALSSSSSSAITAASSLSSS